MTDVKPRGQPRRWGLIVPWAIAVALALAWSGYWLVLRQEATRALNAWSQAQALQTGQPGFASIAASGFPFRLEMTASDFAFRSNDGALKATTPRLLIAISPFDPSHLNFTAPEPITYSLHGGTDRQLTATSLYASSQTRSKSLERLTIEGTGVRLAVPGAPSGGVTLARFVAGLRPDPRNQTDWQLSLDAKDLGLATPVQGFERLGEDLSQVRAAIVLTHAQALMTADAPSPLEPWRAAGGAARVEALDLQWGSVNARGDGEVALDFARRFSGRLSLELTNPTALLGDAGTSAFGPLLARALESLDATFTAADGVLLMQAQTPFGALGPYRLRELGEVYSVPETAETQ
jgi:hypothetical protein